MGDYKDEKRALAETAPPTRLDLGVFNEQSTSLVNNQSLDDDDHPPPYPGVVPVRPPPPSNRRSQPVQTRCFQFKQKYLTTKNLAFAGGVLLGICALIVLYNIFLADDETKYLAYDKVSLGYFRNHNQKISFDETNNLILLSRQLGQHIDVERFALDQKREGFIHSRHDQTELERGLRNCEQLADDVMCCDKTGAHAGAHCVLTQQDGTQVESLAKFHHNFSNNWQSLEDGHKLLPVGNKHGFTILDLKSNIMRKIERRMVPKTYKPVAYFFSMDTYEELAELAKSHDKFHICDYVPDTQHMYLLEDRCRETNMTVKPEFPLVKFCDNPLYSAVLQYGNRENDDDMEWVLQVKSAEIEQPYYASGRETAPLHQVTINCREDAIDFYIPGRSELYHYSVMLPNEMLD